MRQLENPRGLQHGGFRGDCHPWGRVPPPFRNPAQHNETLSVPAIVTVVTNMQRFIKDAWGGEVESVKAKHYPGGGSITIDHDFATVMPDHYLVVRENNVHPKYYQVSTKLFRAHYRPSSNQGDEATNEFSQPKNLVIPVFDGSQEPNDIEE